MLNMQRFTDRRTHFLVEDDRDTDDHALPHATVMATLSQDTAAANASAPADETEGRCPQKQRSLRDSQPPPFSFEEE